MTISPEELIESLQWRYATKVFDTDKKIDPDTWAKLEESMVLTPSSFGLQPWKFITITCPETKIDLLDQSWHQRQVTDCSHLVVLCAKTHIGEDEIEAWLQRLVEIRGVSRVSLEGYAGMMKGFFEPMDAAQILCWAKNQVYIALGQLMSSASVIGVDACPMEGIVPTEYDRILNLEGSGYVTTVACAMGYRSEEDKYAELSKVRYADYDILSKI